MWTMRAALVTLGAGMAAAGGCALLTSYEGFTPGEGANACGKRWPDRPNVVDRGEDRELVGAVSAFSFIDPADGGRLGYNLDGVCTCPDERRACRPLRGETPCDVPSSGIDNAGGAILSQLFNPDEPDPLKEALALGRHGVVIRMNDYNGKVDDARVSVALYNVAGLADAAEGSRAAFDGRDRFIVDALPNTNFGTSFIDTSAYVRGGVLVASFEFDLRLQVPNAMDASSAVAAPIRSAKLIGKVLKVGERGLKLVDAQIVGRIPQREIFRQLARLGICRGTPLYPRLRDQACAQLDVPASPADDLRDGPCDALSFAIGLTVVPAEIGGQRTVLDGDGLCPDQPDETCD